MKKTTLLNPPADASNIAYELVEVLSKVGVEYEYTIEVAEEIWEDFYGRMFNAAHWKATLSKQEKDSFAKP